MKDLVRLVDGKPVTDTLIIAEGVGNLHKNVMELLKKYSKVDLLSTFKTEKVSNGGRPVEYALLNEEQTTFLIMLMRNNEKVVRFKENLARQFYRQKRIIDNIILNEKNGEWSKIRADGKLIYKQKTDVIKMFVDYATKQGSKSASMYYSNFAKMENSALFFFEQKYKNLRSVMNIRQLMQVATADGVIEKALSEGMSNNLYYKDIYKLAKDRILKYADIIGQSPILLKEPNQ